MQTQDAAEEFRVMIEKGLKTQEAILARGEGKADARTGLFATAMQLITAKNYAAAALIMAAHGVPGDVTVETEGPASACLYSVYRGGVFIGSLETYSAGMTGDGSSMGCGIRLIINKSLDGKTHAAH